MEENSPTPASSTKGQTKQSPSKEQIEKALKSFDARSSNDAQSGRGAFQDSSDSLPITEAIDQGLCQHCGAEITTFETNRTDYVSNTYTKNLDGTFLQTDSETYDSSEEYAREEQECINCGTYIEGEIIDHIFENM